MYFSLDDVRLFASVGYVWLSASPIDELASITPRGRVASTNNKIRWLACQEALRIRQEVAACVVWLAEESKMRFTLSEARESADRAASEAMDQLKRAEESHARAEVETVLRLALDSLERDAMIAAVEAASKEAKRKSEQEAKALAAEAESRVIKETAAREEAQKKAEEAERQADEAVRRAEAVESEARQREDSLRAAVLEAESKALEERDAALKAMGDEKEAVERARQEAIREMMMWKEKFEKMQQGLESDATGGNVEKSSAKPVNFNANEASSGRFCFHKIMFERFVSYGY